MTIVLDISDALRNSSSFKELLCVSIMCNRAGLHEPFLRANASYFLLGHPYARQLYECIQSTRWRFWYAYLKY